MKKTFLAVAVIAVLLLCGVSAYAIQGLDESESTVILANDGYATLTSSAVGGTITTPVSALQPIANGTKPGVHITDTRAVFSMDSAFVKSLLGNVSGSQLTFQFGYNSSKTAVTFLIKDGSKTVFGSNGRCVGEIPYSSTSATAMNCFVLDSMGDPVVESAFYPDAKLVRWQLKECGTYIVNEKNVTFKDVSSHWGRTYVDFLASRGGASGTSATTFSPNGTLTRAEFVMFLAYLSMDDISKCESSNFTDVPKSAWYYHAVSWAVKNNITQGVTAKTFSPNAKITREQMARMTVLLLDHMGVQKKPICTTVNFKDAAAISSWAKDTVAVCQQLGIISGYPNGNFGPRDNAARAEAATVCSRIVSYALILPQ